MPDINEWEIFKNDIDRDNLLRQQQVSQDLQAPKEEQKYQPTDPTIGWFSDGQYNSPKQDSKPKQLSADDIAAISIRKFNPQDSQDLYDPYITVNKDFNSVFDNYDEKKYLKGKFGFDVTKSIEENEQKYFEDWDKQNWFVKGVKTIGTTATNIVAGAGLKFAEGLGYIGSGILNGVAQPFSDDKNYMLKVADNGFSKFFEGLETGLKDDAINRTFRPSGYNEMGVFSKMGTSEFWGGSAADGFAFMLSAMIPVGGLFSRIGKGLGLISRAAQLAEEGTLAARATGGLEFTGNLGKFSNAVFGSKKIAAPIQWAYGVASESFFEAKGVADDLDKRRQDPKDPLYSMPQAEFDTYKSEHAKNDFLGNVALLSLTNLFQTRLMFKALGKAEPAAVEAAFNEANKAVVRDATNRVSKFFAGRIGKSLIGAAEGTLMEGYIEENAQLAIERINSSNDKEHIHYDPNSGAFWKFVQQVAGQTKDASTLFGGKGDSELAESILLGGLMGGGMSVANTNLQRRRLDNNNQPIKYKGRDFYKGFGYGEVRNEKDHQSMVLADLENRYNTWQDAKQTADLRAKYSSLQTKLSTATPEEKTSINEDLNSISEQFLATTLATQSKAKGLTDQLILAEHLENTKPIESSLLRSQAFADYFISANNSGLGESLLQSLKDTEDTPIDQLKQFGLDPDSYNPKQQQQYIRIAEAVLDSSKKYNLDGFTRAGGFLTYEGLDALNTNRKNRALNHEVNALIYQNAIDEHQDSIREARYHSSDIPELNTLQEGLNQYLEHKASIEQAQQNLDSKTLSKDDIVREKKRIEQANTDIKTLRTDIRYEAIDWEHLEFSGLDPRSTIINNVTEWMLQDKVGNLNINPEVSEAKQEKQRKDYQDKIDQQSKAFQEALLNQVTGIYALSAYKNAAGTQVQKAEELRKMNAQEFLDYFNEQLKTEKKDAEETAPTDTPQEEPQTETDEPIITEQRPIWSVEETNGVYKLKNQDGKYYQQDNKDFETTDEDVATAQIEDLNKPVGELTEPQVKQTTTRDAGYADIAAEALLTSGQNYITSSDYFLQALSGIFTKARNEINDVRNRYTKKLSDKNLVDLKDFIGTDTWVEATDDIRKVLDTIYVLNLEEVNNILTEILKYPAGLPTKLGNELSIRVDNLNNEVLIIPSVPIVEGTPEIITKPIYQTTPEETLPVEENPPVQEEQPSPQPSLLGTKFRPAGDYVGAALKILDEKDQTRQTERAEVFVLEIDQFRNKVLPQEIQDLLNNPLGGFKTLLNRLKVIIFLNQYRTTSLDSFAGLVQAEGTNMSALQALSPELDKAVKSLTTPPAEEVSIPPVVIEPSAEIEDSPFEDNNPLAIYSSNKTTIRNTQKRSDKPEENEGKTFDKNGNRIANIGKDKIEAQYLTENRHTLFMQEVLPQVYKLLQEDNSPYELVVLKDKVGTKDENPEWLDKTRYENEEAAKKNLGIVLAFVRKGSNTPLRLSKNEAGELQPDNYSPEGDNGFLATYQIDRDNFSQNIGEKYNIIRKKLKDSSLTDEYIREQHFRLNDKNQIIDRLTAESNLRSIDRIVVKPTALSRGVQTNPTDTIPISKLSSDGEIELNKGGSRLVSDGQLSIRLQKSKDSSVPIFPSLIKNDTTNGNKEVFNALDTVFSKQLSDEAITQVLPYLVNLFYVNRVVGHKNYDPMSIIRPKAEHNLVITKNNKIGIQDRKGNFVRFETLRINPLVSYFKDNKKMAVPQITDNIINTIEVDPQQYFKNSSYTYYKPVTKDGQTFEADTIQQYITFNYEFPTNESKTNQNTKMGKGSSENGEKDLLSETNNDTKTQSKTDNKVADIERRRQEDLAIGPVEGWDNPKTFVEDTNALYDKELAALSGQSVAISIPIEPTTTEREQVIEKVIQEETKKSDKPRRQNLDDLFDDLGTRAQVASTTVDQRGFVSNPEELRIGKEYFRKNFPQVPVEVIDGFIKLQKVEVNALGLFSTKLVKLSSYANRETFYHEAFHVAFNLFLTKKQQEDILNEASQLYSIKRNSTQSTEKAFAEFQAGSAYYNSQTNDAQLDERLAFDFQKLRRGSEKLSLTEKLSKWLNDLLAKLKAFLTGKENIRNLYNRIESGYFARQETKYQANDVTRLSIYDQDGKQVMSLPRAEYYSTMANGLLFNILSSSRARNATTGQITINDLKNPTNSRKIYNFIKTQLQYKQEDTTEPRTKKELQVILDNWESFLKYHLNRKTIDPNEEQDQLDRNEEKETEEPETTTDSPEVDEELQKRMESFDRPGNDKSAYEVMSFPLKNTFSIVPKYDGTINPDYNKKTDDRSVNTADYYLPLQDENGVYLPVDTQNLIDYIASNTAGELNDQEFFDKLFGTYNNKGEFVPSEMMKKVPDIYGLMKLLPQWDKEVPSLDEAQIIPEFFRIFQKGRVELRSIITETDNSGNTTTVVRRATPRNEFKIQDRWISNWQTNSYGTIQDGIKYYQDNPKDRSADFLNNIGMVMSPDALTENNEDIVEAVKELRKEFVTPKENPVELLKNSKDRVVKAMYLRLLGIESKYSTLSPSLGVANSEGEMRYEITELNTLQTFIQHVNKSNTLTELYQKMPQLGINQRFEYSRTRQELFDDKGNKLPRKSLYIWNYSEYSVRKGNERFSQNTSRLSPYDKLIMDVQALLGTNIINTPQSESKQTFYSIGVQYEGKQTTTINPHFFGAGDFQNDFSNTKLHDYIKGLYSTIGNKKGSEMDFIKDKNTIDKDIEDFFEEGLKDLKKRITENIGTMAQFQEAVGLHIFNKQGQSIGNTDINYRTEAGLRAFVVNKFINDLEYTILVSGPLEYYGQFIKRTPAWTSTGIPVTRLKIVDNYIQNNQTLRLNKEPVDRSSKTMKVNVVDDTVLSKSSDKQINFTNSILDNLDLIQEGLYSKNPRDYANQRREYLLERQSLKNKILQEVTVSDGQGYVNLDFLKGALLDAGRWNKEMDVAYDYEVLYYKRYKDTITPEELKEFERLNTLIYSQGEHNFVLPVGKFQTASFIEGTDKPGYHKHSLAPMLPSHIIPDSIKTGSKELLKEMENQMENSIAYTTHKSGSKVEHFADKDNNTQNQLGNSNLLTNLFIEGLKEQLKTDNHQKVEVIIGSQFRKLLFNSLFGFDKDTPIEVQRLNQRVIDLTKQLIKLSKDKLFNKLGIEFQEDQLYIKDFTKLSQILQEEAEAKGINTNVKDALSVDKDGRLRNQFESTGMVSQVLDLLFGLVDKQVRVQKTNGNQMVQYSNAYHDTLDFYKLSKDKSKIEKAGVRITLTAEFRKLLNAVHPDGDKVGTLERLNNLLKNNNWVTKNEDALTIVGYRIPTQSQNSMDFAIIKEFLAPTSGNIIQLYDQITLKSGADFDIDKLFVLFPSLTNEGTYISDSNIKELRQKAQDLRNELDSIIKTFQPQRLFDLQLYDNVENLVNDMFSSTDTNEETVQEQESIIRDKWNAVREVEDADKKHIQNQLLKTYTDILSHPSQFKALVTPNNTEDLFTTVAKHVMESKLVDPTPQQLQEIKDRVLTDIEKKIKLPVGSNNLGYAQGSFDMFKLMMEQKRLLGVAAKQNTLFSQIQQGEFNIYTKQVIKVKGKETIKQRIYFPLRFQDNERFIQDNPSSIPINRTTDPFGRSINETNDQMVTGFVDAPSNAMLGASGIDFNNINIFYYLRWTGHSVEQTIDFLNQPVLKDFYLLKNKGGRYKQNYEAYFEVIKKYDPEAAKTMQTYIQDQDRLVTNRKNVEEYLNNKLWNYNYYSPEEIKVQKVASKEKQDNDFMMQMLANFRHFQIITSELGRYTSDKNFDTSKVGSHLTAQQRIDNTEDYKKQPFLTPRSIQDFETSLIYSFDNDKSLVNIVRDVLPIFGSEELTDQLVKDMFGANYRSLSQALKKTYPKVLMQEFMTTIVHTYANYEGNNLQQVGDRYIYDKQESFYHDLRQLINDYPTLYERLRKNNTIMDNIFFESDGKFKVLIDRQNKDVVADIYITELQALTTKGIGSGGQSKTLKAEIERIGDVEAYINNLFTKFTIAAFRLGGFSKSRYNITQMLPLQVLTPIFKSGVDRFQRLSPENKTKVINLFKERFNTLNPKYNPDAISKKVPDVKNYNLFVQGQDIFKPYQGETLKPSFEPQPTIDSNTKGFKKQNLFAVKPIQAADKKAMIKASIATNYIGFGEGIQNSSTELYRQQAGKYANTGVYSKDDIVFVSVGGKRGSETIRKQQQDRTIKEALLAIGSGATLITDNKAYIDSSDYNEGEKRLYKNLEVKGYKYSEQTVDGQLLGVWNNQTAIQPEVSKPIEATQPVTLPERLEQLNTTTEDVYQMLTRDYQGTVEQTLKGDEELAQEVINMAEGLNTTNDNDVSFVINQSPDIALIGTPEEYQSYISSIFPNSKLRQILYHGSLERGIETFKPSKTGIHFGTIKAGLDRVSGLQYQGDISDGGLSKSDIGILIERTKQDLATFEYSENGEEEINFASEEDTIRYLTTTYPVVLNVSNIRGVEDIGDDNQWEKKVKTLGATDVYSYTNKNEDIGKTSYVVKNPEQVHILGSRQDIQQFKDWKDKKDKLDC